LTIIVPDGLFPSFPPWKLYKTVSVAAQPETAPAEISSNIAARALKNEKLAQRDLHRIEEPHYRSIAGDQQGERAKSAPAGQA
jgi:hypothetical protein